MRKLLFNAAMLIGALLLCAPWAMAQQGGATMVTLTLEKGAFNATMNPENGKVEAGKTVTITFTGEPSANMKFAVEGKTKEDAAKVVVAGEGKVFTVTVNGDATVVAKEVAKGGETPAQLLTINNRGKAKVTVVKKGETTPLTEDEIKTLAAGTTVTITVEPGEGKTITKVEVKVGEADAEKLTAGTDGKYTKDITLEAGKKVEVTVDTKENEAPAAGYELVIVNGGAQVKVMKKGATKPLTDAELKNIAKGTDLEITVTADPKKLAIEKVEVKEDGAKAATPLTGKAGKYTYKMGDKKTTLTVITKKVTPVEDAVLAAVAVYPNPFAGELVVANTTEVAKVALVNAQGVVVRTVLPNGANELRLAVEDLPAGVYVLVLERADARKAIRLVK